MSSKLNSDSTPRAQGSGKRWAVFISGQGTNLQSLIDANPLINIVVVISSKSEAYGVQRATQAGIPVQILSKNVNWQSLSDELKSLKIDFIFLLGFMKIIPESFVLEWPNKILNLHPSLLPLFKGLNAIERSYEDGAAMGVTIHWVVPELDAGPILIQEEVIPALLKSENIRTISLEQARLQIQKCENKMVVEAVRRCEAC